LSAASRSTISGIERIAELGLDSMEIEFVQGVKMSEATAASVKEVAGRAGVRLTAHGPYAINLNSADREKAQASKQRILKAATIGAACGAESVVFHAAFYGQDDPSTVYQVVKRTLDEISGMLQHDNIAIWLRTELTGKSSDFGTLDEIIRLGSQVFHVAPCIDFAHLHARTGEYNSYDEFVQVLKRVESTLGRKGLDNMHMHVSGVQYTKRGETRHLPLKESDFRYMDLMRALHDMSAKGFVVCESPNLEEDALLLRQAYHSLGR
jgi:deoxyribonuclease-4